MCNTSQLGETGKPGNTEAVDNLGKGFCTSNTCACAKPFPKIDPMVKLDSLKKQRGQKLLSYSLKKFFFAFQEMKISEKFDFLMEYLKKIGGGEFISFNNSVFLSERETADRNFALAYYMKENQSFPKGFILQETLDFYFQVSNILFIESN